MNKLGERLSRALAVGAFLSISLSGCVMVHSSAISESTGGGSGVSAEYSDYGFLHLTEPLNLTTNASAALLKQCQSGMVSDVQTELSMRDWFLIVQDYTVDVSGVCK